MNKEIRKHTVDHMQKAADHLSHELAIIRTGRASVALLDIVKVDYYGTSTPIKHVANVSIPDARTIMIQPFQPDMLSNIEKAIQQSDLGLTPNNDGHVIRLPIPSLTEERRKDIIKLVHKLGEETKITIRNIRRDAIEKLRAAEKSGDLPEDDRHRGEKEAQELTDKFITEIDKTIATKEEEIMTV